MRTWGLPYLVLLLMLWVALGLAFLSPPDVHSPRALAHTDPLPLSTPTSSVVDTPTPAPPRPTWTQRPPSPSPTPTAPPPTATPTPLPTATATLLSILPASTPEASATPTVIVTDCQPEATKGCVKGERFTSALEGEQIAWIYLPPGYPQPEYRYPVLYMFHGSNSSDGRQWINVGLTEAADAAIVSGALPPFLIVMPLSPLRGLYMFSGGGSQSYEAVVVNDLIPHIDRTYPTIPTREGRAIGGLSRGAYWSLEIAFRHPDLFRAVGGHSAALSVATAPPGYHPYELAASPAIRDLRIYLDTGENDYLREGPERLHGLLDANGVPHIYSVNPGAHDEAYWAAHVAEYLAFYAAEW